MRRVMVAAMLLLAACSSGSTGGDGASPSTSAPTAAEATGEAETITVDPVDDGDAGDEDGAELEAAPGAVTAVGSADPADPAAGSAEAREAAAALPTVDGEYLETFDSPDSLDSFDFYLANGRNYFTRPASWPADHAVDATEGPDATCGLPDTTRTISFPDADGDETPVRSTDPGQAVYWCAPAGEGSGHFMTAFHTGGYAHLDFSPKQVFSDVRRVCWDVNATNLGNRKWQQVVIAPTEILEPLAPRLDYTLPEFRGEGGPANWGLEITEGVFMFIAIQGGAQIYSATDNATHSGGGNDLSVSDQTKRVQNCLIDRGAGQVEVHQERWSGNTDVTTLPGSFPTGEVRVIFQDVSYDPDKAYTESPPLREGYTWHWDNILISSDTGG